MPQSVFFFGNGVAEGTRDMTDVLGGKGANLAEMTNLGVPVPQGFTIACSECIEFLKNNKYSDKLRAEVEGNIARLEQATGKKLGDPTLIETAHSYGVPQRERRVFDVRCEALLIDLKLVAVAFDPAGRNSVAVLRDMSTKEQYRVKVGQQIGRMRVAAIREKEVVFGIEEFGYSRQESVAMNDSTKVRTQ